MELTTLKQVVCVNLDFHLWSARRQLRKEDLKIVDGEVPPREIASLGSKKICNPEDIAEFEALKKEAQRACANEGVKFLGGYAVPESKAANLAKVLDDVVVRFYAKKKVFLDNYDKLISDWVAAHPGWEKIIRDSALDSKAVDGKIAAGWQAFKIVEPDDPAAGTSTLTSGLASAAKGLAGQLYWEVAKAADELMEKSLMGRDKVTQKIKSPIKTIRDKLEGLAFIDNRVKPLVDTIDHIFEQLPAAGHIDGMALSALTGLVFILSSEDRMRKHGELILAGKPVDESFHISVPQKTPQPVVTSVAPLTGVPVIPAQIPLGLAVGNATPAAVVPPVVRSPVAGNGMFAGLFNI